MNETFTDNHGIRVRAYFGERDRHQGQPLWSALLQHLREHGAAGATVTRGVAGFGANSRIHVASIIELSSDLPLVLEWVDAEDQVNKLLPEIEAMLQGGMLTTDRVSIIRYQAHQESLRTDKRS